MTCLYIALLLSLLLFVFLAFASVTRYCELSIGSPTGQLASPENVLINESVNSATIEWKPPYSSLNSDTKQVDPHIIQYTVYITDIYTGNIFKRNVTETRFTFNASDDGTCPMFQVSAWNAGGEGELSEPVHECRPRSKFATFLLKGII